MPASLLRRRTISLDDNDDDYYSISGVKDYRKTIRWKLEDYYWYCHRFGGHSPDGQLLFLSDYLMSASLTNCDLRLTIRLLSFYVLYMTYIAIVLC